MAETLEFRIGDLSLKFGANALVFFGAFHSAGAVATGALQALPDRCHHFFIFV